MGWETKSPLQHPWNVSVDEAIKIQLNLVPFVSLKDEFVQIRKIASVGFTFLPENKLKAACALFSFPQLKLLSSKITLQNLNFAYISGFLAFSVGPALISVLTQIEKPDLVIFPGRGVAHPRSMGLATHLGILLEVPSVACSKRPLGFEYKNPPSSKGSFTFVYDKGKKLVAVLRSKTRVNPIFVTSGHKVTLDTAVELVLKMCTKYRLPEPLRIASILAKKN